MAELIRCLKLRRSYNRIRYLMECGANVNYIDERGKTPLHWCAAYDHADYEETSIQVVMYLIGCGADVNAKDFEQQTPLMLFIFRNCCPGTILILLQNGADVKCSNIYRYKALHHYSRYRNKSLDICRRLMAGVDIDAKNNEGETPLMRFLLEGCDKEYIELLLNAGANVALTSDKRNNIFHFYALWRFNTLFRYDGLDVLMRLYNGTLLNKMNTHNITPLMAFIVYMLPVRDILFLLERGANISSRDQTGNSVLHLVSTQPNGTQHGTILVLLQYGANPNATNQFNESILHGVLTAGNPDTVMLLYNYGMKHDTGLNFIEDYVTCEHISNRAYDVVFKYLLSESEYLLDDYIPQEAHEFYNVRNYLDNLCRELRKMKLYIIADKWTLFDFFTEPSPKKASAFFGNCSINFRVLQRAFPRYADVARSKIDFSRFLNRMYQRVRCVSISSKMDSCQEGHEIHLNVDCFCYLLEFLSIHDIRKLILASLSQ